MKFAPQEKGGMLYGGVEKKKKEKKEGKERISQEGGLEASSHPILLQQLIQRLKKKVVGAEGKREGWKKRRVWCK